MPKRTAASLYSAGILLLSLGVALNIQSGLGTSPFDALLVGLSDQVGLTVGSWEILIAFFMIMVNSALVRQRPELWGLFTAFLTGAGIDLWLYVFEHSLNPAHWASQLATFGAGIVLINIGTALYLFSGLAAIPIDRLTMILKDLLRSNVFVARTAVYFLCLLLAFLLGGPIGVGTVLTVCLGGLLLNFFVRLTARIPVSPAKHPNS